MRQLFSFIHATNFDVAINECYYDLCIGTSALVINQYNDDQPFLCTSIPMDKLAIEEAVNGKIESWFRTWQNLKIVELNTRWPKIVLTANLIADLMGNPDAVVRQIYEGVAYFAINLNRIVMLSGVIMAFFIRMFRIKSWHYLAISENE